MTTTHPMTSIDPNTLGCRLVATDGRALPLRSVDVAVSAGRGLASVQLTQRFVNPHAEPLAATYQLPLPADGAVVGFSFVIDGRRVVGRVEKRADARAAFERALVEGRTAGLLEQERSSVFTQELANLLPGAHVEVTLEVEQPLVWRDDGWEWRFPTVVAPRFLGTTTPDADRMTVDVADTPPAIPCTVRTHIADTLTGAPTSSSHGVEQQGSTVTLRGTLDRDVVLRWPVASAAPGVDLETCWLDGHDRGYGLLTVVPPERAHPAAPVARDLILLLDTSGSMGGAPLAQLKAFSRALVRGLRPGDQLEMIEFSRRPNRFSPAPVRIDEAVRAEALAWIDGLVASGGTHMHDAIRAATATLRDEAQRQVVLVTDGLIGFEHQIVGHVIESLPTACRVHTVGIGSAPNRSLTGPVALAGGGYEAIVGPSDPVEPAVQQLLARTSDPLVVDVTLQGPALLELAPLRLPDLMAGSPSRIALSLRAEGGQLTLRGRTADGAFAETIHVPARAVDTSARRVVATRFARDRVEALEMRVAAQQPKEALDAEIEALGLRHQIATRLTSWVAETTEATVDPSAPSRHERIPQALPHAMSAEGLGLRPAVAAAPGARKQVRGQRRPAPKPSAAKEMSAFGGEARRPKRHERPRRKGRERSRGGEGLKPPAPRGHIDRLEPVSMDDDESFADGFGAAPEEVRADEEKVASIAPAEPVPHQPALRLQARVRSHSGGLLVLEVVLPHDLDWSAQGRLVAQGPDGATHELTAEPGTTRPGALAAGLVARLVVRWQGDLPRTIAAASMILEIVA
ncbi:MAG: VIT and VWA domain-containing protein [Myxococcales bacterium]|nr:VIT and VWA domain-containing protein [Myxococcales bacterium]